MEHVNLEIANQVKFNIFIPIRFRQNSLGISQFSFPINSLGPKSEFIGTVPSNFFVPIDLFTGPSEFVDGKYWERERKHWDRLYRYLKSPTEIRTHEF